MNLPDAASANATCLAPPTDGNAEMSARAYISAANSSAPAGAIPESAPITSKQTFFSLRLKEIWRISGCLAWWLRYSRASQEARQLKQRSREEAICSRQR